MDAALPDSTTAETAAAQALDAGARGPGSGHILRACRSQTGRGHERDLVRALAALEDREFLILGEPAARLRAPARPLPPTAPPAPTRYVQVLRIGDVLSAECVGAVSLGGTWEMDHATIERLRPWAGSPRPRPGPSTATSPPTSTSTSTSRPRTSSPTSWSPAWPCSAPDPTDWSSSPPAATQRSSSAETNPPRRRSESLVSFVGVLRAAFPGPGLQRPGEPLGP